MINEQEYTRLITAINEAANKQAIIACSMIVRTNITTLRITLYEGEVHVDRVDEDDLDIDDLL